MKEQKPQPKIVLQYSYIQKTLYMLFGLTHRFHLSNAVSHMQAPAIRPLNHVRQMYTSAGLRYEISVVVNIRCYTDL